MWLVIAFRVLINITSVGCVTCRGVSRDIIGFLPSSLLESLTKYSYLALFTLQYEALIPIVH